MAVDDLIADATRRMDKAIENTRNEFHSVRTGRASAALLDRISIEYYGQRTPLKQLATTTAPARRILTTPPSAPSALGLVEKAIQEPALGLTPPNDGKLIRLPI